jgi:hypothetical protein
LFGDNLLDEIVVEAAVDKDRSDRFGSVDKRSSTSPQTFVTVSPRHFESLLQAGEFFRVQGEGYAIDAAEESAQFGGMVGANGGTAAEGEVPVVLFFDPLAEFLDDGGNGVGEEGDTRQGDGMFPGDANGAFEGFESVFDSGLHGCWWFELVASYQAPPDKPCHTPQKSLGAD